MDKTEMIDEKPENPPAFPETHVPFNGTEPGWRGCSGMSLRDYFAATALNTITIAIADRTEEELIKLHTKMAQVSYSIADAMLKERLK